MKKRSSCQMSCFQEVKFRRHQRKMCLRQSQLKIYYKRYILINKQTGTYSNHLSMTIDIIMLMFMIFQEETPQGIFEDTGLGQAYNIKAWSETPLDAKDISYHNKISLNLQPIFFVFIKHLIVILLPLQYFYVSHLLNAKISSSK